MYSVHKAKADAVRYNHPYSSLKLSIVTFIKDDSLQDCCVRLTYF